MITIQTSLSRRYGRKTNRPISLRNVKILLWLTVVLFMWLLLSLILRLNSLSSPIELGYQGEGFERKPRRLGILVGIFTADIHNDKVYRSRHRKLFLLWNDRRVCTLDQFQAMTSKEQANCELIYTFVVGANSTGPTEWVEDGPGDDGTNPLNPILVPPSFRSNFTASDLNKPDVTRLNIRENMNEGKSQTWFKYANQVIQKYPDISYAMKLDTDSILHLHEFFQFAYKHLPPPPYSDNAYVGSLRDKAFWPKKKDISDNQLAELEGFFGTEFEGVHLYLAGQCYILSANLLKVIGHESKIIRRKLSKPNNNSTYLEGHEDHDIAAMVFHSPEPLHLVTVGRKQRFWEHPVKGEPRWRRIWHREVARTEGRPFEGKLYTTDSTFETVMARG